MDVKWIKLHTDIFSNRKIKQIRRLPEGDAIIGVWLQILCLAGQINDQGNIMFATDIPYTDEMLAVEFDRPLPIIRIALKTFEGFGMMECHDDIYKISNWHKYQSADKLEQMKENNRRRVAKYREKMKALQEPKICAYCGDVASGVDHVIPLSKGGKDRDDNKVDCCLKCNQTKNNIDLVDFLNKNRDRINDDLIAENEVLKRYVMLCNVTDHYHVMVSSNSISISNSNSIKGLKNNKERKKPVGVWEEYAGDNLELLEALKEWEKMRNSIQKPLSDRARRMAITSLEKVTKDPKKQIKVIDKAIFKCWQSFYQDDDPSERAKEQLEKQKREDEEHRRMMENGSPPPADFEEKIKSIFKTL